VDALEYGCSFQRIAWELVNDALWLVGPGSHPPDERRFTEHPDWARVMRIFSARVDVTLYLAPFLDKKGFSGALSKRMDGVLIATSVRRSSRAALRDAFLELWGSDAPMIGYLGLDVPYVLAPRGEVELSPAEPWASARFESSASAWPYPAPPSGGASPAGAAGLHEPPARVPPAAAPKPPGSRRASDPPPEPPPGITRAHVTVSTQRPPQALVERISDEVRRGHVPRSAQPRTAPARSYGILLVALLLLTLAGAGAWFAYHAMRSDARRAAHRETLPAGTERMLPADLGAQDSPAPGGSEPAQTLSAGSVSGAPQGEGSPAAEHQETNGAGPGRELLPYRVHVASFRSEKTVRDLVRRLRLQGLDAWYAKATDQPSWYRVFVGHYATRQEAAQKAAELLNRGWVDHAMAYPDNAR
jgi:septal ring-binding cell division protein DamX